MNQVAVRYFPFRVRLGHGEAVAFGEFPVSCLIPQFLEAGAKCIPSGVLSKHEPSGRDTDRLRSENLVGQGIFQDAVLMDARS